MKSLSRAMLTIIDSPTHVTLQCHGVWTMPNLAAVAEHLELFTPKKPLQWDIAQIAELDSAGIALLQLYYRKFENQGVISELIGTNDTHTKLYSLLYKRHHEETSAVKTHSWLYHLGKEGHENIQGIGKFLAFLGESFVLLLYTLRYPSKIRYRSIMAHIYTTGVTALPIIGVSAFLIGVVIAFQSLVQLQKFGADIFIVDTIGISLTRELAPLITAIVVAGRSGSAFTAQIGAMKMTQEIDAMKTMGFDPFIFLVWPRVFALILVMPLLIFFADLIGIFGGMVVAKAQANLSFDEFLYRLKGALAIKHYVIGIAKGPFFAFLIAMASTYRGFQISLNTESIGHYTTVSVVNSIFLVIACDALFSVLLTELKL
ncbi:MAG: ABC transporter permease [Sulfuricurvum sp.]|jgi:phospholipid/cholesterol/gamma-HCH transport system permease protein|nr:ABC transporter permease [Sulfuricurvum sp.]MDP3022648.1 ABC transporter permease [Sulfuricurvum sp.]MDP3120948.1 ABC transporter permease [Sulfuricurvum sp.]